MEMFYKIVLGVAVMVLLVILIIMGLMLQYQNNQMVYPPVSNTCPDYWVVDPSSGFCQFPTTDTVNVGQLTATNANNASKLGTFLSYGTPLTVAPYAVKSKATDPGWSFDPKNVNWTTICDKKAWANQNGLEWDGVTNYNSC